MAPAPYDGVERFNAVDALNVGVILVLAAVVAFFRRPLGETALWLVGVFASLLLFIVLTAVLSSRRFVFRLAHDFSPALILPVLFNTLGPIIDCASPQRWDVTFAELDARFFGELAVHWRATLGHPGWLADLAYVAYVSYYVAPVVLAVIVYRDGAADDFRRLVFTVLLTFYASYAGYFAFPTLGPRVPQAMENVVIGGGALSHAVRWFIDVAERTRTDAFPSGHTAVALVCLSLAWRISAAVFGVFVPVVTAIVFSTVYLHYHYVVDVLAGAGLAGACVWLAPRLQPILEPREMMRWFAVRLGIR